MAGTKEGYKNPAYDTPLDQDKLVSWARFKRGFKAGVRFSIFKQAIGLPIVGVALATAPAEIRQPAIDFITNITPEQAAVGTAAFLAAEGVLASGNGAVAGTIDSFRPTSRQLEKHLAFDGFRALKRMHDGVRSIDYAAGAVRAASTAAEIGKGAYRTTIAVAGAIAEASSATASAAVFIARPPLPEAVANNRLRTVEISTVGSGLFGGYLSLSANVILGMDRIAASLGMPEHYHPWLETMADRPLETALSAAAVGLTASTYAVIAGRRTHKASPAV
jgi:hypothetical protein